MNLTERISYCGIPCSTCPIYIATKEKNIIVKEIIRQEIANFCNKSYQSNYTTIDINDCDGCRKSGKNLFVGCSNCKIRSCARNNGFESCAECMEYPCSSLEEHFAANPGSKIWLQIMRSLIKNDHLKSKKIQ